MQIDTQTLETLPQLPTKYESWQMSRWALNWWNVTLTHNQDISNPHATDIHSLPALTFSSYCSCLSHVTHFQTTCLLSLCHISCPGLVYIDVTRYEYISLSFSPFQHLPTIHTFLFPLSISLCLPTILLLWRLKCLSCSLLQLLHLP